MTQLFRIDIFDTLHRSGVTTYMTVGEPVTVNAMPMVRMAHGTIIPASGFSATRQEARLLAADKIEAIGRRILNQAERLRQEAESE